MGGPSEGRKVEGGGLAFSRGEIICGVAGVAFSGSLLSGHRGGLVTSSAEQAKLWPPTGGLLLSELTTTQRSINLPWASQSIIFSLRSTLEGLH